MLVNGRFIASPPAVDSSGTSTDGLELRSPSTSADWERYYELRWRVLRAPWDQPRGSEKDDREQESFHVGLWDLTGKPVAAGRVQLNSPMEAQVRFMAVDPAWSRKGLGSKILAELEAHARSRGAQTMILNARDQALPFYERHGYVTSGKAHALFGGAVAHVRMKKQLSGGANACRSESA